MQLEIKSVSKTYPNGVRALHDVSLSIKPGMFGLLGPNGAGKSTLMRTIATLQDPDVGTITLGDIDVLREKERVRETLGYLPQEFVLTVAKLPGRAGIDPRYRLIQRSKGDNTRKLILPLKRP